MLEIAAAVIAPVVWGPAIPLAPAAPLGLALPSSVPTLSAPALGRVFDGGGLLLPVALPEPPSYVAPSVRDRSFIVAALEAAKESPTARRILRRAESLDRAIHVGFRELGGDHGGYDYTRDRIQLDGALRGEDPRRVASTLVHELIHVLQHEERVPAEALELELEAHALTLRVERELGLEHVGFSKAAAEKLAESPVAYMKWLSGQLPGKPSLLLNDMDWVESELEEEATAIEIRLAGAAAGAFPRLRRRLEWILRDLALVQDKKGRARYRRFATRVRRLLRKEHLSLEGFPGRG